jgi:D-cysteine desulfhydrase
MTRGARACDWNSVALAEGSPLSSCQPHAALARVALAHLPTPLWHNPALDRLLGCEIWVKRDDMSAGAAAGNKIRKLEYLLAEAQKAGADHVITCGAAQSNHARATAILARGLGMPSSLLLRAKDPRQPGPAVGNLALDQLVGADCKFISYAEYADRARLMQALAQQLAARGAKPYVIPEGGSNGLGAIGYFEAMREVRQQLEVGLGPGLSSPDHYGFDLVVHACGSGGTAAGISLGAGGFGVAPACAAVAVCDDVAYFEACIQRIEREAAAHVKQLSRTTRQLVFDQFKGPAYGVANDEQRRFIRTVAATTSLILDPVYSGKALWGLSQLLTAPERFGFDRPPRRVLFVHTGGLPGLLAEPAL